MLEERSSHGAEGSRQKNSRCKGPRERRAACGWKVRSRGRRDGHLPSGDLSEYIWLYPSDVGAVGAGFKQKEGVDPT